MPKIDFYILPEPSVQNCLSFACRLVEKAYKKGHRIYLHTKDQAMAFQLDELLWTYRDESFLPHNILGEGPNQAPPIQIGFGEKPEKQRDILINLSHDVPLFYTQFNRILELITTDNQEAGRNRYRFYRSQNIEITTHKIESTEAYG